MDDLTPTSGKAWRANREQGLLVTFKSGNVARIRPVGLDLLVRCGRVPDILQACIVQLIETGKGDLPREATLTDESAWFDFLNGLAELAFVSPRVVPEPQADDEISPWDIELADKMQLWEALGAPARALVHYFRSAAERVEPVAAPEVYPPAGQPDPGRETLGQPDAGDARRADGAHGRPGGDDVRDLDRKPARRHGQAGTAEAQPGGAAR